MAQSKIEWTDETRNPAPGCRKVGAGCRNCYAERLAARLANMGQKKYQAVVEQDTVTGKYLPKWNGEIYFDESALDTLRRIKKPQLVFVESMGDLFYEKISAENILKVLVFTAQCPQHTFQILTKRPQRAYDILSRFYGISNGAKWPFPNVWLGVSCSGPDDLWMIEKLLQIPGAVHYVSLEPLLEGIDILKYLWLRQKCIGSKGCGFTGASYEFVNPKKDGAYRCPQCGKNHTYLVTDSLDQAIVGGESGPGARPMHPQWVRDIRNQCVKARTPFFFKQWGEWELSAAQGTRESSDEMLYGINCKKLIIEQDTFIRVGKKKAGRILDGRTWDEMPDRITG